MKERTIVVENVVSDFAEIELTEAELEVIHGAQDPDGFSGAGGSLGGMPITTVVTTFIGTFTKTVS
jgi:hypothetical protein